jgi:hypothetical protein
LSGFCATALALPEYRRENLSRFLVNRAIKSLPGVTVEDILETVALMADRRVGGFSNVFIPRESKHGFIDSKFLSSIEERYRIPAVLAECREALRVADHPAVVHIEHDYELKIDWRRLPDKAERYTREKIEPHLLFSFRDQNATRADVFYRMNNGRQRIMEVKTTRNRLNFPKENVAKGMLQVFRHALLVRQHKLEGVEYVLRAPRFAARMIAGLKEILDLMGTNYVIYLRDLDGNEVEVIEKGMKRLGGEMAIPIERRYPFVF